MKSDFYIHHAKFQDYSNQALDWFIKSWKQGYDSDEWKISRLKYKIFKKRAAKHLTEANKCLN